MMMLRLARAGAKKRPVYHLVAADRRARRDGRHVEQLGYFVPGRDILVVKQERIDYWLQKGAQPTETVGRLIKHARKHGNTELPRNDTYVPPPAEPVEAKPAEAEPKAEAKPEAETRPQAEAKPEAESEPQAEAETKTDAPADEASPAPEREAAPSDDPERSV